MCGCVCMQPVCWMSILGSAASSYSVSQSRGCEHATFSLPLIRSNFIFEGNCLRKTHIPGCDTWPLTSLSNFLSSPVWSFLKFTMSEDSEDPVLKMYVHSQSPLPNLFYKWLQKFICREKMWVTCTLTHCKCQITWEYKYSWSVAFWALKTTVLSEHTQTFMPSFSDQPSHTPTGQPQTSQWLLTQHCVHPNPRQSQTSQPNRQD